MGKGRKPRLALWRFTSCGGCLKPVFDGDNELSAFAEVVDAEAASPKALCDLSLVEGSISTPRDAQRIQQARRLSKYLVAVGACATAGGLQALRNFAGVADRTSETLARSTPVSFHVFVDIELRGCPVSKAQLVEVLSAYLNGRKPNIPAYSLCLECKRNQIPCVTVDSGTPCMGPVTQAGCGALCPAYSRGCYGCFGPMETPNARALTATWQRAGTPNADIVRAYRTFNAFSEAFRKESERNEE